MNHSHHRPVDRHEYDIREIKAGGRRADKAIGCLYLKYRQQTFASLSRLISRYPDCKTSAEDLLHDSFITLLSKIQHGDTVHYSFPGFWIGIGKNLFLNQLKKDSRITFVHEDEEQYGVDDMTPESLYLTREEEEQLHLTFSQLGARCQEILLLWFNRYSMMEIARVMNLSNDAMARKLKFSCCKKLKELVRTGNKMPG